MYDPYREEYHRPSPPSGKSKAAQASASLVNILSRAADALYNEYNEKPSYLQKVKWGGERGEEEASY